MADTVVSVLGPTGDTEIDLYADFAENELEAVGNKTIEIIRI